MTLISEDTVTWFSHWSLFQGDQTGLKNDRWWMMLVHGTLAGAVENLSPRVFLCFLPLLWTCAALCIECVYMGIWRPSGSKARRILCWKKALFFFSFSFIFSSHPHRHCILFVDDFFFNKSWATEYSTLTSSIYNVLDYVLVAFSISSLCTA